MTARALALGLITTAAAGCGARTSLLDSDTSGAPTHGTGGSAAAGSTSASSTAAGTGSGGSGRCTPGEGPVQLASGQMGP